MTRRHASARWEGSARLLANRNSMKGELAMSASSEDINEVDPKKQPPIPKPRGGGDISGRGEEPSDSETSEEPGPARADSTPAPE